MLKQLILVGALCITPFGVKAVDCPEFSQGQVAVLKKAHAYGSHNMGGNWGVVLAAISYQESSAGDKVVNHKGSYGVFQNKLTTVTNRTGERPAVAKKKLIRSFDYSAEQAKNELDYWNERYYLKTGQPNNLTRVLASYNAGYNVSAGKGYAKQVKQKMKIVEHCIINKEG